MISHRDFTGESLEQAEQAMSHAFLQQIIGRILNIETETDRPGFIRLRVWFCE